MNLFDILGPVMVGPSSSHTAGAVRIGYISEKLLQDHVRKAEILLHGSFATTGIGHGTDKALIAGLLGMHPDDIRIPASFDLAKKAGMEFTFSTVTLKDAHPNTAVLRLSGEHGRKIEVQAASIGGGRILIAKLDGIEVNFTAEKPTLIVHNVDQPGHVAQVTSMLAERTGEHRDTCSCTGINGAVMLSWSLRRTRKCRRSPWTWLEQLDGIIKVTYINVEE